MTDDNELERLRKAVWDYGRGGMPTTCDGSAYCLHCHKYINHRKHQWADPDAHKPTCAFGLEARRRANTDQEPPLDEKTDP